MAKNLEEIMEEIRSMQQNVRNGMSKKEARKKLPVSEEEIREYVDKETKHEQVDKNSAAAKYIGDLLARNPKIRKGTEGLASLLPKANEARKEKMAKLRLDASRSGINKVIHDFGGGKRRDAKKELRRIAQDKLRSEGKDPIANEETALKDISVGRSRRKWRLFQPLMNRIGLGSHGERHNKEFSFPTVDQPFQAEDVNLRTPNGKLVGKLYDPGSLLPEQNQKVVIFFSGSGGPSSKYCAPVVQKYLNADAKVLTLDYRGFGNSETLNRKGQKTGTPLSEKSIYEDGKEMLKYVTETMGVKPENIILHGFSLGGAVASKVAADFYQEQQKKALEEGRLLKEQKLGGIVLQSPIDSMYNAATAKMWKIPVAGFMGWSGAGGYNTKSHMQRLHKLDPDIPVHYVSGSEESGDPLDINRTGINNDPKARFWNSSSLRIQGGHEDGVVIDQDDSLDVLIEEGRNVEFGDPMLKNLPPQDQRKRQNSEDAIVGVEDPTLT